MSNAVTLGVFAHVDAGKTTLCEQLLVEGGALRTAGRVDRGDTCMDTEEVEKRRGITVFVGESTFTFEGRQFTLIDTPGHTDFSAEMERALEALDAAVVVISAPEGVQAHTRTVCRLLRARKIPVFFFINKTDRPWPGREAVLDALRDILQVPVCVMDDPFFAEESQREGFAAEDEALLEVFLAGNEEDYLPAAQKAVCEGRICPVIFGAALHGEGTRTLLQAVSALVTTDYPEDAPFSGRILRVRHDAQGVLWAYVKVLSGRLVPRQPFIAGGAEVKLNELRCRMGGREERVAGIAAGGHGMFPAPRNAYPGMPLGDAPETEHALALTPLLRATVTAEKLQARELYEKMRSLQLEDPLLDVRRQEETVQISYMGEVQLEILTELCRERFGLEVRFGPPQILYRETLKAPVYGAGHYEPLRHYAEVHLLLEPAVRGSGIEVCDRASLETLPLPWHTQIRNLLQNGDFRGALIGAPLSDVRITLTAARAHLKHTEGGDFREAVHRAVRQGLFKGECALLEPYYRYMAETETALSGKIDTLLERANAPVTERASRGDAVILEGRGPVRTLCEFGKQFMLLTHGRGVLSFAFDGYDLCADEEQVCAQTGYDRQADREHPADSVFCQHGAGFLVHWDKADAWMHIPQEEWEQEKLS